MFDYKVKTAAPKLKFDCIRDYIVFEKIADNRQAIEVFYL